MQLVCPLPRQRRQLRLRSTYTRRLRRMLNRLSPTKSVTVRQVQRGLAAVLADVSRGHKVAVTRHGKVVAHLVPAGG